MTFNISRKSVFSWALLALSSLAFVGCNPQDPTGGANFCGGVLVNEAPAQFAGADRKSLRAEATAPNKIMVRFKKGSKSKSVLAQTLPASAEFESVTNELSVVRLNDGVDAKRYAEELRNRSDVANVELDSKMYAAFTPNDPMFDRQWHHKAVNSTATWDIGQGNDDVVVAVIDTGIDTAHGDLKANMWVNTGEIAGNGLDDDGDGFVDDVFGWNFINNSNQVKSDDAHSHGSHVAGLIGAVVNNSNGVAGMSPHVKLMALKFLDSKGEGDTSDAVKAVYYAINHKVKVINASWGGTDNSVELQKAILDARAAGILFVVAAGNDGKNNDTNNFYPANNDGVFSVASTDCSDKLSSFSDFGAKKVHIGAPGEAIISTISDDRYGSLSGTSMATPVVAGVAALIFAARPDFTPAQVEQAMMANVDPIPALQGKVVSNGRVNAFKALKSVSSGSH